MIGVIVVNKPQGISSNNVVVKIKKILNERKVGHLGTLDPLATGVLPICIGKATRLFNYFLKKKKKYIARFQFGFQTDTLDLEGNVIKSCKYIPTLSQINEAIKKNFLGKIMQIPPIYSSKKINGKNAYDFARSGKDVDLKACPVEIFSFISKQVTKDIFEFIIECSSGTYIRSLARDLGESCNSCATMVSLQRIESGCFSLRNSINYEDLSFENIKNNLISIEEILKNFNKIDINENLYKKLRNGIKIPINSPKNYINDYAVFCSNKVVGIGKIIDNKLSIVTYFD